MEKKLNVLLITGIVTSEHDPKMVPMIKFMLESTGRFKVKITEEFTGCTAETLEKYDLAFVLYDGKESVDTPFVGWGATAEKALYDFVKNGGGCVMYHSSLINSGETSFPEEYVRLCGCDFNMKDSRKSPKLEGTILNKIGSHKIMEGAPRSWVTVQEDLFLNHNWLPDHPVTVLATFKDELTDYETDKIQVHRRVEFEGIDLEKLPGMGEEHPAIWVHDYGKGHVFCVCIGHGPDTLRRPTFTGILARGCEWAATGDVSIPYPDLAGWKRLRAWPFYTDMTWQERAAITSF